MKNNISSKLALLIVCLLISSAASAYDFTSNGIYYHIMSRQEKTVKVVSNMVEDSSGKKVYNTYSGSVVIPTSVTNDGITYSVISIDGGAFRDSKLTNITIPNSITEIGWYAFKDCTSLTNITIPNSVTEFGGGVFYGCTGLKSVTMPNSVTYISTETFYNCIGLTNITIPNSITKIGDWAFSGCENLKKIYNYSERPQSISENVFDRVDKKTCILYVPKGAVKAYRASSSWKKFLNVKEF